MTNDGSSGTQPMGDATARMNPCLRSAVLAGGASSRPTQLFRAASRIPIPDRSRAHREVSDSPPSGLLSSHTPNSSMVGPRGLVSALWPRAGGRSNFALLLQRGSHSRVFPGPALSPRLPARCCWRAAPYSTGQLAIEKKHVSQRLRRADGILCEKMLQARRPPRRPPPPGPSRSTASTTPPTTGSTCRPPSSP